MSERRAAPLIVAKQVVPPVRPGAVPRARLHAPLLDNARSRLSVVVAPAGWGKTTLLSQWAHDPAETRGIVWVSLDEADDDPVRFWTYVLTALQRDVPGLGRAPLAPCPHPASNRSTSRCRRCSTSSRPSTPSTSSSSTTTTCSARRASTRASSSSSTYLPAALRVVIAGRSDPPLPLARLRARGELAELRAADLGFTVDEAAALLTAVGDAPVDTAAAPLCGAHRGLGRRAAARGADDPPRGAAGRGGRAARRRRPAHPRLPVRRGRRPAGSRPARPARPGRRPRAAVRSAVRRGARSHRIGGGPGRAGPGGPVRDAAGPAAGVVPLPPAVPRRPAAPARADDPDGAQAACSPGPPTGSSRAATSPRPSRTGSPPGTRRARRTCCAHRSRLPRARRARPSTCSWVGSCRRLPCCGTPGCACRWPGRPA